jgi:four helix bundle protein
MNKYELSQRTRAFAVRILKMVDHLPNSAGGRAISSQVARSGTSVAANYRATLRARSDADFRNKVGVVLEEADETLLWLEIIGEAGMLPAKKLSALMKESDELVRIFAATHRTVKSSLRPRPKS